MAGVKTYVILFEKIMENHCCNHFCNALLESIITNLKNLLKLPFYKTATGFGLIWKGTLHIIQNKLHPLYLSKLVHVRQTICDPMPANEAFCGKIYFEL